MARAKLDDATTGQVADLIKIHIQKQQLSGYTDQLNQVLTAADVLQSVDVSAVEPTAQTHGQQNVWRLDHEPAATALNIAEYPNKRNLRGTTFVVKRFI